VHIRSSFVRHLIIIQCEIEVRHSIPILFRKDITVNAEYTGLKRHNWEWRKDNHASPGTKQADRSLRGLTTVVQSGDDPAISAVHNVCG